MPKQSPGIFGAKFCTTCGQRQRGPNHVCHPSAVDRYKKNLAWQKASLEAATGGPKKR